MKGFISFVLQILMSVIRDSSACIGYSPDSRDAMPGRSKRLLCTPHLPESHWATKPRIQWISESCFLVVKQPVREAEHSYPSSVEVKNNEVMLPPPPIRLDYVVLT
jgi:hypothetical protein